jgi:hypothetical protein
MYGLLTAVVKEIKTLRGMFGLGGGSPTPAPVPQVNTNTSSQFEVKSKTTPEIPSLPETKLGLSSNELREVITLDFSKPENKIVVSDVEDEDSDDEEDEESDESSISDDDEGEDSDEDDDISIKEVKEEIIVLTEEDVQSGAVEVNLQEVDLDSFYQPTIDEAPESAENEIETTLVDNILVEHLLDETSSPVLNIHPQEPQQPESVEEVSFSQDNEQDNALLTFDVSPQTQTPAFQIDQLRKMNINQLKAIASQIGITSDISKTKKPELISLIQSHST